MNASARPNVLVIMADQWRGQALSCAGDPNIFTPNVDRLAAEGVLVANSFSSDPVCTPARAAVVTGRYPHATGMMSNHIRLGENEPGFAQALRTAGYATGYVGKWHLDGPAVPGFVPPGPRRQGFDYWAGFNGGHNYWRSVYFRDTDDPIQPGGYEPDYQTDLALEFIQQHHADPFCLFLSWGPPHAPLNPPEAHRALFALEQLEVRPNVPEHEQETVQRSLAGYYGHIAALDANLARLLSLVDDLGIAGQTLILFTSDHGDLNGAHGLRGKRWPLEESVRVPLLLRWPNGLPAAYRPDVLVSSVDVAPTILGLCGVPIPAAMQGRDVSPWLRGDTAARPPEDAPAAVYLEGRLDHKQASIGRERFPGMPDEWRAIRTHRYKLVVDLQARPVLLYDLHADPYERTNLVADERAAETREVLLMQLRALARDTGDEAFVGATVVATV